MKVIIRDREKVSKRQSDLEEIPTETQSSINKPGRLGEPDKEGDTGRKNTSSYGEDEEDACLARCWADFDRDLTLLLTWYRLDENTVSPVYRLLPVR